MPIISGGGSGGLPGVTVSGAAAASKALIATSSSAASWSYPPGFEVGYDQITSTVNIVGTTSGTATTVITCAAHTFDGAPVVFTFFSDTVWTPSVAGNIKIGLFESGSLISQIVYIQNGAAAQIAVPVLASLRFTPTAAAHTYVIGAWVSSTTGTPLVGAGAGTGGSSDVPAFARFVKV